MGDRIINMENCFFSVLLMHFSIVLFVSCENGRIEKQLKEMCENKISIPFDKMIKKDCNLYHDNIQDSCTKLVKYIEIFDCSDCQINQLSSFDNETYNSGLSKNIAILYVVNIPYEVDVSELYSKLCVKRVRGTVYLDTCQAFLQANPHIPDDPLFHTFVLDEQDNVVLVGDPFKNEKMEKLLLKVIEREKQQRRSKTKQSVHNNER